MKSLLLLLVGLSSLAFSAEAAAANNSVVQKTAGDGWEGLGSYFSGKHFVVDSNLKCTGRIGKNFKDCKYDAVIDCDDILALNGDGWPVGFRDEEVVTQLKKPGLIVAVLGLFNRGKTHILEKMTGKSLAPGLTQTTKGLSIIAPESQGSHVLYIDTAGFVFGCTRQERVLLVLNGEACLWLADMSAFTPAPAFPTVNETTSRLRSEQFLQFVAVQLADYPVLVVSELTLADQDYIWNFVEKMLVPNRPSAITLIVVHNLKDMKSIDEVELKIQNDIVHCMGATKMTTRIPSTGNELTTWRRRYSEEIEFIHLVLAQDKTPAGNKYNARTYEYLTGYFTFQGKGTAADGTCGNDLSILDRFMTVGSRWLREVVEYDDEASRKDRVDLVYLRPDGAKPPAIGLNNSNGRKIKYIGMLTGSDRDVPVSTADVQPGRNIRPLVAGDEAGSRLTLQVDLPGLLPPEQEIPKLRFQEDIEWASWTCPTDPHFRVLLYKTYRGPDTPPSLEIKGCRQASPSFDSKGRSVVWTPPPKGVCTREEEYAFFRQLRSLHVINNNFPNHPTFNVKKGDLRWQSGVLTITLEVRKRP